MLFMSFTYIPYWNSVHNSGKALNKSINGDRKKRVALSQTLGKKRKLNMSIQKFITNNKLVEYLDREATDLLLSHAVYDIGNYGWQSEDTEDPEYIGHAMWQTNPPVETEWDYIFNTGVVRHRPTEKQKLLTVAGNDFEGLMRASRMSIGLCLLHKSIAMQKPLADNHYFWLHHTDSILQLDIASDRLREYFIVTFFDETSERYKSKSNGRKNNWYVTPFIQARDSCQKNGFNNDITNAVAWLPDMAEKYIRFVNHVLG